MKYRVIRINKNIITAIIVLITFLVCTILRNDESLQVNSAEKLIPIYSVETNNQKIAITFDAAWSAEDTDELIDILNAHNAKATFYIVGDWAELYPNDVYKLYEAGHELGNHSDTHKLYSDISRREIRKELTNCNKKLESITENKITTARAPSGDYDNNSIELTESLGMKMIQWDVDSLDYCGLSVTEIFDRVINNVQNGSIVLFHNGIENTPEALEKILTELENDGYEFVTVSDLIYWENYEIDHTGRQIKIQS